jgi:hypothetical protein
MVSPYIAGALQGLEKGLAAQELKKQKDMTNFLAIKKIEADANKNALTARLNAVKLKNLQDKALAVNQLSANHYQETLKELNNLYPNRPPEQNIKEATRKAKTFQNMLQVSGPTTIRNLGYEQRQKNKLKNQFLSMKQLFGGKVSDEVLKMALVKGWEIEIVDGTPFMKNRIEPWKTFALPSGQRLMDSDTISKIFGRITKTPEPQKQIDSFKVPELVKRTQGGDLGIDPDTEYIGKATDFWNLKSKKRQEQVDSSRPYYKGPTIPTSDPRRFTYPSFKAIGTNRLTEEYMKDFAVHGNYKTNYWDSNIGNVSLSKAVGDMTLSTGGKIQNLMSRIGIAGLWPKLFSPKAQAFRSKIETFKINMLKGLDEAGQKKFSWLQKKLDSIFRVDKAGYFKSIGAMKGELVALVQMLNTRLMYINNQLDPKKSWTGLKAGPLREEKSRLEYMLTLIGNPYRIDTGEKTPVSSILRTAKDLGLPKKAIKRIEKYEKKMDKNEKIGGRDIKSIKILN